jgi:hypothetical protein
MLRVGWRNFFSSCAVVLCQFLVLAGSAGTCSIPADCFGIEREIVFGVMYVLSVQYSCAVTSVFLYYDRKKSSSHLSGGCAIIITTGKKRF